VSRVRHLVGSTEMPGIAGKRLNECGLYYNLDNFVLIFGGPD